MTLIDKVAMHAGAVISGVRQCEGRADMRQIDHALTLAATGRPFLPGEEAALADTGKATRPVDWKPGIRRCNEAEGHRPIGSPAASSTSQGLRLTLANAHQQRVMEQALKDLRATVRQVEVRVDHHGGGSWKNQRAILGEPRRDATSGKARTRALAEKDMGHIRTSLRKALPFTWSPHRIAARLGWELRLILMRAPVRRHVWLPKLFPFIPGPDHFDHIAHLRAHPEIWATPFNGKDEWLPYHHHLLGACKPSPQGGNQA